MSAKAGQTAGPNGLKLFEGTLRQFFVDFFLFKIRFFIPRATPGTPARSLHRETTSENNQL